MTINPADREHFRGMSPDEIKFEIDQIDRRCRELHEDANGNLRTKSAIEQSEFREKLGWRDAGKQMLEEHRILAEVASRGGSGSLLGRLARSLTGRVQFDTDPSDVLQLSDQQARDKALRGLESRGKDLGSDQQDRVEKLLRSGIKTDSPWMDGSLLARRVLITESEAYRSAWSRVMTSPHPLLSNEEIGALRAYQDLQRVETRAMSEGTTTAGGFGVPVFIDPSIIMTAQGSGNPFLQIAKVVDVNTSAWKGVSSAGVTWSFDAEASVVSDDSPTLAQPQVTVFMARGFIPFSIEVGMDYPGFAEEMAALLGSGYDELTIDKFTRGTGTGEPRGILTQLSSNTNVRVKVATNPGITVNDPYNVWQAVPQRNRRSASWLMNVQVNDEIRKLGTANVYHAFTVDLAAGQVDTLFAKGVYESPYMPTTTTSTTATEGYAIVGDFSNYVIARRSGLSTELVPALFQQQTAGTGIGIPTGQRGWFSYARVGGSSANDLAFRLLVSS